MGLFDTLKDLKALAVGIENIELISKLMDVQIQAYEILDENRELRLKLEELERSDEIASNLSYEADVYYKKNHLRNCWNAITFICGYAVGQMLTVLLLYMGYTWHESRNED
jgi:hypothetical protein